MHIFNRLFLLAGLLLLLGGCGGTSDTLTVVFPEVGSADAALLMTDTATVLIDTGESGDGDELLALLETYGRDTIDLLILSHYDKDHVGGAAEILGSVSVRRVIGSTYPKDSDQVAAYRAALSAAGLTEEVPSGAMSLTLGGMELTIDPPKAAEYSEDQSNNSSLIVSVTYGETNLLFAGDAMAQRLAEFDWTRQTYDLVKIPHHGRDAETLSYYLPSMRPGAAAIITSSKKEPENDDLLDALSAAGMVPYRTRKGAVTVISNGKSLTIQQAP